MITKLQQLKEWYDREGIVSEHISPNSIATVGIDILGLELTSEEVIYFSQIL